MGQQQLLLIVLGVIIVGIAVVVGINVFAASSLQANNNAVISDLQTIGSMAQQFYRKPKAMGGGGNTWKDDKNKLWTVPPSLQQTANMSAKVVVAASGNDITLTAKGTEKTAKGNVVSVVVTVTPTDIKIKSTNVNEA